MIVGYNDFGRGPPKLCHMPLRGLIGNMVARPFMNERHKHLNWGKQDRAGGCLKNWPYSRVTGNGHYPFGK